MNQNSHIILLIGLSVFLLIGLIKSTILTKNYIFPPPPPNTIIVTNVISNIEKEREEYRLGVYCGARSMLTMINGGKKTLNDNEIFVNSLVIKQQIKGEKR
jgi:hypothetical protein